MDPLPVAAGDDNNKWSFARLVQSLLDLSGDFRIRLSSIEITEIPDEVDEAAATHPKLLPVLSHPASVRG